jgi:hypothetical protein
MGQVPSDIKKSIENAIREGTGQEFLGIVKELKNAYYLEDVAAAAIALYAKQGGQQEERVRRRTLDNLTPVPHKAQEATGSGERRIPIQPPTKPGEHNVRPGHSVQKGRPASRGQSRQTGQPGQNRPSGQPGQNKQTGQPGQNRPRGQPGQSRQTGPPGQSRQTGQQGHNRPAGQPEKNKRR